MTIDSVRFLGNAEFGNGRFALGRVHVTESDGPRTESTSAPAAAEAAARTLAEASSDVETTASESCWVNTAVWDRVLAALSSSVEVEDTVLMMLPIAVSTWTTTSRMAPRRSASARIVACFCSASKVSMRTRWSRKLL